jgi:hypothetical protein
LDSREGPRGPLYALVKAKKIAKLHMEKARLDAEKLVKAEMIARSKAEEKAGERKVR